MSESQTEEIPLVFECEGDSLLGIVHRPNKPASVGLVTIIAGGPQYRAGVARQVVNMARELSKQGIAVLRFDHRGVGDSAGTFRGFEHNGEDVRCAVEALRTQVPEVEEVVLWGGCDGASSALIHGWAIPDVASLVVGNPWITTAETQEVVMRQHYLARLRERAFWAKLVRGEYELTGYAKGAIQQLIARLRRAKASIGPAQSAEDADSSRTFVDRMLAGLQKFRGPVLFVMSGQSMLSREFDALVKRKPGWHAIVNSGQCSRVDFPDADQTFSDQDSREKLNRAIHDWIIRIESTTA